MNGKKSKRISRMAATSAFNMGFSSENPHYDIQAPRGFQNHKTGERWLHGTVTLVKNHPKSLCRAIKRDLKRGNSFVAQMLDRY